MKLLYEDIENYNLIKGMLSTDKVPQIFADTYLWFLWDELEKKWKDNYKKQWFEELDYFYVQSQQVDFLFLSYDEPASFTKKEIYEKLTRENYLQYYKWENSPQIKKKLFE